MGLVTANVGLTEVSTVIQQAFNPDTATPALPISRVTVGPVATLYNPTASATAGQASPTRNIATTGWRIHAGQREVLLNVTDSGPIGGAGRVDEIQAWVRNSANVERLLFIYCDTLPNSGAGATPVRYSRTADETVTFSIGFKIENNTITSITISRATSNFATNAQALAGTSTDTIIAPSTLKHVIDSEFFSTSPTTVASGARDLGGYTTPGLYHIQPPSGENWVGVPDTASVSAPLLLEVHQYGADSNRLQQWLYAADRTGTASGVHYRITNNSGGRTWGSWVRLGSLAKASSNEVTTGTSNDVVVTPLSLAGSSRGGRLFIASSEPTMADGDMWAKV